jgi:hypothetical protein
VASSGEVIEVENDAEIDALTAQVLAAGNKIAESERAEMIRRGWQPSEDRDPRRYA